MATGLTERITDVTEDVDDSGHTNATAIKDVDSAADTKIVFHSDKAQRFFLLLIFDFRVNHKITTRRPSTAAMLFSVLTTTDFRVFVSLRYLTRR